MEITLNIVRTIVAFWVYLLTFAAKLKKTQLIRIYGKYWTDKTDNRSRCGRAFC